MSPAEAEREIARLTAAGALPQEIVVGGASHPARQATDEEFGRFGEWMYYQTGRLPSRAEALNLLHTPTGIAVMLTIMYQVSRVDADRFVADKLAEIEQLLTAADEPTVVGAV